MARATSTNTPTRKSRSLAIEDAKKRKPGRPVGSTNAKKSASATAAKVTKPAAKRVAAPKAAARAPKLNKAELETQVGKLERAIGRLRDKNKELKQAVTEAREHKDTLQAELSAKPTAAEVAKPARKSRRPSAKASPEVSDDHSDDKSAEA